MIGKIEAINNDIKDAKIRYNQKEEVIDGCLEFKFQEDLLRYIDAQEYEKINVIKNMYKDGQCMDSLPTEDQELVKEIEKLKKILPEELYKCIGCPCIENDFPNCYKCSFQISCSSGNNIYPDECTESDCYNSIEYGCIKIIGENIKESLYKNL
ncbi:hypothetical protein IAI10_16605 [Clostridium sp. 19966]|uniref:hypothetical protein n=1 Tax=Clostridium sp. 19966 TaxID=2768166 RepID=UPI0028DDA5C1|nr:hypothetical protein [Clostridium sp. 19966]MDT8718290.1 hypothetical protein [Clostridium sp. 19966]